MGMRRSTTLLTASALAPLALTLGLVAVVPASAGVGNGAPPGPHFNLNIHGVANGQGFNGNNQNDIFVPLNGKCNIDLSQASTYDFQVLSSDCVNNPPASFELPAPCSIDATTGLCTSSTTVYSVYARALGKPGGQSNTTPCFTDTTGTYCSIYSYVAVRGTGKSSFTNETSNLLFVTQCINGKTSSTPIFSSASAQYFWSYDNQGLRLAQLRFYQVPSAVPTNGNNC
jgi:hypothetical protein